MVLLKMQHNRPQSYSPIHRPSLRVMAMASAPAATNITPTLTHPPFVVGRKRLPHHRHCQPTNTSKTTTTTTAAAAASADSFPPSQPISNVEPISEIARQNLSTAANVCRRYGWLSFWVQLVLTSVSAVIVLFSMAFTYQTGPQISLYLTLFGIVTGLLSTFWSFGYTRLSRKLRQFLDYSGMGEAPKIRRTDVINMLEKGAIINALGAGASMLGLQATIGMLVAKTLTTATVNPFLASNTNTWNPVLAFDVFNVQATTNALLSHFFSLMVSLWLLRTIANRPSAANVIARASPVADNE